MTKIYRSYKDPRLNKLRQVIESRVESGVLPIPSYGSIGRGSLLRKPFRRNFSTSLTDYVDVYFDDHYSVGCLRGTVSFNPVTGWTAGDAPLFNLGFSNIEILVLDSGFEDLDSPSFSEYLEVYSFGQHIREDFCVTWKVKYPFKLKFVH